MNKKLLFLCNVFTSLQKLNPDIYLQRCRLINDFRLEVNGILMEGNYEKYISLLLMEKEI
jgi:hypothetical protein